MEIRFDCGWQRERVIFRVTPTCEILCSYSSPSRSRGSLTMMMSFDPSFECENGIGSKTRVCVCVNNKNICWQI